MLLQFTTIMVGVVLVYAGGNSSILASNPKRGDNMNSYINALLLRFDGVDGADAPSKEQVAIVWAAAGALLISLLR